MTNKIQGHCQVCFEDLEDETAVEYKATLDSAWHLSTFCNDCIEMLRCTQFERYCKDLATTKCAREARALLKRGPPLRVYDRHAFPSAGNSEVHALRLLKTKEELPSKLEGALEGAARQIFWDELKQFALENDLDTDGISEEFED